MRVTIVGAGNMGRAIATRAMAGGHEVEILDRDPAEAKKLASEVGGSASALEPDAPFGGEVVVLALYYPGIKDVAREYAERLTGKVVVDITNPPSTRRLGTGWPRRRARPPPKKSPRSSRRARRWSKPSTPPSPARSSRARSRANSSTS